MGDYDPDLYSLVSHRAIELNSKPEFLLSYLLECGRNLFHKEDNPNGYTNMGTAVNALCQDIITAKVTSIMNNMVFDTCMHHYENHMGIQELRKVAAGFITEFLESTEPVQWSHVAVTNGVTSALDACAYSLADTGDVFLTPTPAYARIYADCSDRANVEVVGMPLKQNNTSVASETFQLTADVVEDSILKNQALGKNVRAVVITNPCNPLGEVYPPDVIKSILDVCHKYDVHYISDEIYALSVHDKGTSFHSVLKYDRIPDPLKTHVLWGLSKDICVAGLRCGFIVTKNPHFLKALEEILFFQCIPTCVQKISLQLLSDKDWIRDTFLPASKYELSKSYKLTKSSLEAMGVTVRPSQAGVFIWADFRNFITPRDSIRGEMDLFYKFYEHRLYIVPGSKLMCESPGWFRIVFAVAGDVLLKGLERIKTTLSSLKQEVHNGTS